MLTAAEVDAIKAEIKRLGQAGAECQDSGIQKRIDDWIKHQKEKLRSDGFG